MKRVAILRHAKSSWDDAGLDDFDRPLNARGRKAAWRVGEELRRRGLVFDQVIASPAARVRETLEELARGCGEDLRVRFAPEIYQATGKALEKLLRALPEEIEAPLLVGHNPALHELLLTLASEDERGFRGRIAGKFPTAALAVVELDAVRWCDIAAGGGRIAELILPRELD